MEQIIHSLKERYNFHSESIYLRNILSSQIKITMEQIIHFLKER